MEGWRVWGAQMLSWTLDGGQVVGLIRRQAVPGTGGDAVPVEQGAGAVDGGPFSG